MVVLSAALLQADPDTAVAVGRLVQLVRLQDLRALLRAAAVVAVGIPLVLLGARWTRSWITTRTTPHRGLVVGNLLVYTGALIVLVMTLQELGFSLGPLLGAAGVFGIAIGFAAQTSVSNIISGFFLMGEQPFVVGDLIQVGTTTGRVLSIDMMSVKLRTFDNRFVRIPNEQIVKSEVTTVTRFPVRRLDIKVGVAYKEDIGRVRRVLMEVADANPLCLVEPEPLVIFQGYGDSSIDLLFAVWATRESWLELKNTIQEEVKTRFDADGIEIPFPHRTLYTGSATEAFPVRMVDASPAAEDPGVEATPPP